MNLELGLGAAGAFVVLGFFADDILRVWDGATGVYSDEQYARDVQNNCDWDKLELRLGLARYKLI